MAEQGDGSGDLPTVGPSPVDGPWPPEIEGIEPHEVVGSGGSGTVWKCLQPRFHRWVAVKVVDTRLNARSEALFERECSALGGLSGHPHIVPVHAGGLDGRGRPYLVMPFVETGSLADLLKRQGALDWRTATELMVKVSGALQVAHDAGILHRDVKPENVLMTRYGEPQLADFGLARIAGVVTTATNTISATPVHAAPEVLNGKPATECSDVYGLASSLYRLICGTPAFYDETDESLLPLLARIATQEPKPLTQFGVPAVLAGAVERGMAKQPLDRTTSAHDFARALIVALQSSAPKRHADVTAEASRGPIDVSTTAAAAPDAEAEPAEPWIVGPTPPIDLRGFPLPPLPSPAGAFVSVAPRARLRLGHAVVAGGVALLLGGGGVALAVTTHQGKAQAEQPPVVAPPSNTPTPTVEPSRTPTPSVEPTPTSTPATTPTLTPNPTPTSTPTPAGSPNSIASPLRYTGRVVDGEGHSLAGIWVTPFDAHGPVPFQPDLVTEADGSFSTDCGVKVLLTSWPVVRQQPSSARNLAVTWVGGGRTFAAASDVPCRSSRHRTIMPVGGILEGAFHVYRIDGTEVPFQDGGNPGGGLYCPGLWLNDLDAYTCSGWQIRHGRYRFVGLPTGTYRLNTEQTADRVVEVVAGRTTTRDWYDCEQCNFGRVPPSKTIAPSPSPVSPS